jgi:hypothetical protein
MVELGIAADGDGALYIAPRVVEQHLVLSNVNAGLPSERARMPTPPLAHVTPLASRLTPRLVFSRQRCVLRYLGLEQLYGGGDVWPTARPSRIGYPV